MGKGVSMIAFRYSVFRCVIVAVFCCIELVPASAQDTRKHHEFDFWLGSWNVQNKRLQPSGQWSPTGTAVAQIRSAVGGKAIVERWNGQDTLAMRGFSLRTFDAEQKRWEIILNWHSGSPSTFALMVGNFRGDKSGNDTEDDYRAEFFPPVATPKTRYTFSKITPDTCQWDQALSADGTTWQTDWIMEFARTQQHTALETASLEIEQPTKAYDNQFPGARQLDHLIGNWKGDASLTTDEKKVSGTAERITTSILDGLALLELTKFSWGDECLAVYAFNPQTNSWAEVGIDSNEPDCHWLSGSLSGSSGGQSITLCELATSDNGITKSLAKIAVDSHEWTLSAGSPGSANQSTIEATFRRVGTEGRIEALPTFTPSRTPQVLFSLARQKLQQNDAPAAEELFRELLKANPLAYQARFMLGYSLHLQKKLDAALVEYSQASKSPAAQVQAMCAYNTACIYALRDDADQAIAQLTTAIGAGFANLSQLETDTDFDSIRADPRFISLIPKTLDDSELFVEPTRIIHKFTGELPGDQFGWTGRRVGKWDNDDVTDFVLTAPTHSGAGKVYVYSGATGKLLLTKEGSTGEQFGNSATSAGDVNKDGSVDLIVGAPNTSSNAGNAYVYSGKDGQLLLQLTGSHADDGFGYEVSPLGDVDGDEHDDVFVGAPTANGDQPGCGVGYIYSGKTGELILSISGQRTGDSFANAAAAVRLDAKTILLAIGAQNAGPNQRGQVDMYHIINKRAAKQFSILGDAASVNLGQMFISFPGDINGDGVPDVYTSDFSDKTSAPGAGKVVVCDGKTGEQLFSLTGNNPGEGLGTSPSDAGDVNGDGIGDLVIGAWQNADGAKSGGKCSLVALPSGEVIQTWTCRQAGDTFGFDACGIGDVDGDGHVDFLLTSAWSGVGGPKTGRAFVIAGGPVED